MGKNMSVFLYNMEVGIKVVEVTFIQEDFSTLNSMNYQNSLTVD